ncbi:radical SAM protein [Sellimonas sp.]|uniref:radical SAM protein n=1 Tax=Sellimonas sp. TaxID=2021466 RepID=UPI0025795576|nr:radical SAM protein [Sellimonas sp.]
MINKKFYVNHNRIELIITYKCNLRCINCDAQVRQAPSNLHMSIDQIYKFIDESIKNEVCWEQIRILGGEPTLHPEIENIVEAIFDYKSKYSNRTIVTLVTNGYGEYVNKMIRKLSEKYNIVIENSKKKSNMQPNFSTINKAPKDMKKYCNEDFSRGCWIPSVCGMALDIHGYYPCSAAAAADRIFGDDIGRKKLPLLNDDFHDVLSIACGRCGHYYNNINEIKDEKLLLPSNLQLLEKEIDNKQQSINLNPTYSPEAYSETWAKAIKHWENKEIRLTNY